MFPHLDRQATVPSTLDLTGGEQTPVAIDFTDALATVEVPSLPTVTAEEVSGAYRGPAPVGLVLGAATVSGKVVTVPVTIPADVQAMLVVLTVSAQVAAGKRTVRRVYLRLHPA